MSRSGAAVRLTRSRALPLVAALALLLPLSGCSGGSGSPTEPQPSISFTSSGAAGANTIFLQQNAAASTATVLVLEVRASQVEDLYGVSFDLTFPSQLLSFDSAREGTFLGDGGTATSLQVASSGSGRLVVGHSRLGGVPGASGSGPLLELRFTSRAGGTGDFVFDRNQAWSGTGAAKSSSWLAGSVRVVR